MKNLHTVLETDNHTSERVTIEPPLTLDNLDRMDQEQAQEIMSADVRKRASVHPIHGVVIGDLVGIAEDGTPQVDFPGNDCNKPMPARAAVLLSKDQKGQKVALVFEQGDSNKPILMGPIVSPTSNHSIDAADDNQKSKELDQAFSDDGERITFNAKKEIVLRCGKSSITLTRAGKILLRGAYLLSRSSGANRIKGGSVQIN